VHKNNTLYRRAQRSAPPIPPDPQAMPQAGESQSRPFTRPPAQIEELVKQYLPLTDSLVQRHIRSGIPPYILISDLKSIAYEALFGAVCSRHSIPLKNHIVVRVFTALSRHCRQERKHWRDRKPLPREDQPDGDEE
jgi:DNA-directed RNA polymerase specialized sigma subunit